MTIYFYLIFLFRWYILGQKLIFSIKMSQEPWIWDLRKSPNSKKKLQILLILGIFAHWCACYVPYKYCHVKSSKFLGRNSIKFLTFNYGSHMSWMMIVSQNPLGGGNIADISPRFRWNILSWSVRHEEGLLVKFRFNKNMLHSEHKW